jgi:LPS-assembly protein
VAKRCLTLGVFFWLLAAAGTARAQTAPTAQTPGQVTTSLPYKDGTVVLTSDEQGTVGKKRFAKGNVRITFEDLTITCEEAEFDETTREGTTTGKTIFSQAKQWLNCSHSEFNLETQTATLYDVTGYTDEEFLVQGKLVVKTGHDTYRVDNGSLTACKETRPKWAFDVSTTNVRVDQTARLHRVIFRLKGIPVFYFPYLVVPLENKKRSSGFLLPHIGNSSTKGRQYQLGYYQTLGKSADLTLTGDYYSKRGFGLEGIFRAVPNDQTRIDIQAFGVNDRLNQGGAHLVVDAHSLFQNGFRAAAKINITTNFQFRQAFSEGLRSATIPEEQALVFATRNFDSFSSDFSFERNEVFFPGRSLVIRKSPSLEFRSLGKPLGKIPLIFYFRGAAEGMYRLDSSIETPRVVQRLDFHPRVALRLPSLAGFSLLPSIGIRETYYSAHLSEDANPKVISTPMRRQYADLEIDLRTPGLERDFHSSFLGNFQHQVEPQILYRRIHGITNLNETIRFDDQDAIADTNEIEYAVVNRIIRTRESRPGFTEKYEFLAFTVAQKYYFDPTFGGAFRPDEINLFYPLNTISGFASTGIQRNQSPTSLSLRLTPRPGFSYDLRADYDTKLGRLRDTSIWGSWQRKKLRIAGTYVKTNALEASMFSADHVQAQFEYNLAERGFSVGTALSYNIQTRTFLNSNSRLNYVWNCCGISLEFQQYDLGVRTETRFTFSFSLKGIGNFGNLKQPNVIF